MDKDRIRTDSDGGGRMSRPEMPPEGSCGCGSGNGRTLRMEMPPEGGGGIGDTTAPGGQCPEAPCVGHEGCDEGSWGLCRHPLAMVYAPCQYYRGLYDPETALARGTLFEELDLPLEVAPGASCPLERHG